MRRTSDRRLQSSTRRAQSTVVGVAVLLGITMVSLGVLTASIGAVVQENAASADAGRVAADMDTALAPVETTGPHRGRVSFTAGRLSTTDRTMRVLNDSGVVATERVDALVFESGRRRVAFDAGAVVRGDGDDAQFYTDPPIVSSQRVLVVGVARLDGGGGGSGPNGTGDHGETQRVSIGGNDATTVGLRTNVTHHRTALGRGHYRVAVETETPDAWESYFRRQGANTTRRDFDGDGIDSVVATCPGNRTAYLVVHDMHLEVRDA